MQEGQPQGEMLIRVFYLSSFPGDLVMEGTGGLRENILHYISEEFKVSYLYKLDPIYHELCFSDEKGIRHQFIGLPYHVKETMPEAAGIDGQA